MTENCMLGLMIYSHHIGILNNFTFELVFWCESNGTMECAHERKSYMQNACSLFPMFIVFPYNIWGPDSTKFYGTHDAGAIIETQSEYKISLLCLLMNKQRHCQPRETTLFIRTIICLNIEKQWHVKEHKYQKNPFIYFYLYYFSVLDNHLWWKWLHRRKGKNRATP